MERSEYYQSLRPETKARYEVKLKIIDGKDPYILQDLSSQVLSILPEVTMMDMVNYLILTHSYYTGQNLKAFKSLQAYKYYESGFIQHVQAKQINENAFVVTGRVKHSQKLREAPVQPWIIILNDGSVSSGQCTCMAGLGEVCSHIAALLFFLHFRSAVEEVACTSQLAQWPVPSLKKVEMLKIKQMDFVKDKKKIDLGLRTLPYEEMLEVLEKFDKVGVSSACTRLLEPFSSKIENLKVTLPPSLEMLFDANNINKSYEELIQISNQIELHYENDEIMLVEKVTRNQSLSLTWFKQRAGRITASNFKSVCRTPIEKPSLSVIKGVCYPQKMCFTSKYTKYGAKHEKDALSAYLENEREKHIGFTVKTTGFFISKTRPEYGASPDAMVECNCCGKGSVEIKCPYLLRNMDLEYVRKKDSCLKVVVTFWLIEGIPIFIKFSYKCL